MAYKFPFQFLNRNEVKHLSVEVNKDFRSIYIDCLGMLQAILARFSSSGSLSMFEDSKLAEQIINQSLANMPSIAYVAQSATDMTPPNIREERVNAVRTDLIEKLDANRKIAVALRDEYETARSHFHKQEVLGLIDQYLDQLLLEYKGLRHPNIEVLTA